MQSRLRFRKNDTMAAPQEQNSKGKSTSTPINKKDRKLLQTASLGAMTPSDVSEFLQNINAVSDRVDANIENISRNIRFEEDCREHKSININQPLFGGSAMSVSIPTAERQQMTLADNNTVKENSLSPYEPHLLSGSMVTQPQMIMPPELKEMLSTMLEQMTTHLENSMLSATREANHQLGRQLEQSINASMQATIRETIKEELAIFRTEINKINVQIATIETDIRKMAEGIRGNQQLIATLDQKMREVDTKIDEMENQNRRSNIKICGIPNTIKNEDLVPFLTEFFSEQIQYDIGNGIERAYRIGKPQQKNFNHYRDVICKFLSYNIKQAIMDEARKKGGLVWRGHRLELFNDVSKYTMDRRRILAPLTKCLREKKIPYQWGHPLALKVRQGRNLYTLKDGENPRQFLGNLGLDEMNLEGWSLNIATTNQEATRMVDETPQSPKTGMS